MDESRALLDLSSLTREQLIDEVKRTQRDLVKAKSKFQSLVNASFSNTYSSQPVNELETDSIPIEQTEDPELHKFRIASTVVPAPEITKPLNSDYLEVSARKRRKRQVAFDNYHNLDLQSRPTILPLDDHLRYAKVVLDEMYQFVALLDFRGDLLVANTPALLGAGIQLEDVMGKPFESARWWALSKEIQDGVRASIIEAAKGNFVRYEVPIYGSVGGQNVIWIDYSVMPVVDKVTNQIVYLLAEGRNISEKKKVDAEVARKNEELKKLYTKVKELDELKSQFFANVSHELRTPLTLILGPTQRLLNDAALAPYHKDFEVIHRSTQTLLKHVNDLLDVSKMEAKKMEIFYSTIDVSKLARLVASHFDVLASDKSIQYKVEEISPNPEIQVPASSPFLANIDKDKIQRVLLNLLSNAFKFTPVNGSISIQTSLSLSKNLLPEIVITVTDSGVGVPEHLRSVIFERFRQAEGSSTRKFGGTGLGLAICKEFVELHGGTIQVDAGQLDGSGSLFTIRFPVLPPTTPQEERERFYSNHVADEQALIGENNKVMADISSQTISELRNHLGAELIENQSASASSDSNNNNNNNEDMAIDDNNNNYSIVINPNGTFVPLSSRKKPTVLIVEDNFDMNNFIQEVLQREYTVYKASNGRDGLAKAIDIVPDLIVSDCMMPYMSGDEMVRHIRTHRKLDNTPIMLLTAKADDALRVKVLQEGVQDYLNKPFSVEELLARARNLALIFGARKVLQAELESSNHNLIDLSQDLSLKRRELKQLLQTETEARNEAERLNRIKDEFLMTLSHELRTPLTGIMGWTGLLRSDIDCCMTNSSHRLDLSEMKKGFDVIDQCSMAQNRIIDDLLDVSRIISGKLELDSQNVIIDKVIDAALASVQLAASAKRIKITRATAINNLTVLGDFGRLQQVVWNLLSNAIKFTPPMGHVHIIIDTYVPPEHSMGNPNTGPQGDHSPTTSPSKLPRTEYVRVQVRDNGRGINPKEFPLLFKRFGQLDSSSTRLHGGLGLGLAICRHIVELHGGSVTVASEGEGKGATFAFYIPHGIQPTLVPRAEVVNANPLPTRTLTLLSGIKILVVDDEKITCMLIETILKREGAEVIGAWSAPQAVQIIEEQGLPDVMLTDLSMPHHDGFGLLKIVRQIERDQGKRIPVAAVTAYVSENDKAKVANAGFDLHLSKPLRAPEFVASVAKLVGRSLK